MIMGNVRLWAAIEPTSPRGCTLGRDSASPPPTLRPLSPSLRNPPKNADSYYYPAPSRLKHSMQKDGSQDAGPSGLPGSPLSHDASSSTSTFQPSANMRERLRNLAKWRIDPSSIEFPKDTCEFKGGHATVSRAFLVSPSDGTGSTNQSDPTESRSLDEGRSAEDTSQELKDVAVKKMKMSGNMERVLGLTVREAEFLVGLSHENIIKLEGFVEDLSNDIIWLVFPWEENGTLMDFIASANLEIPERISLIFDVAKGVEHLHSQQPPICHGDLKSLNVLVNSKYHAVITDFGSARRLKTDDVNKEMKPTQNKPPAALSLKATFCATTNTITLTGDHYTLRWAAPELLYDEEPSLCSDIWALGWVAYEIMTGFIPFQDVKDTIVIKRVVQGDLPSISGDARMSLIQALCSLMLVCWSIDPSKRPTAKDCRKSINFMPMATPDPLQTSDTAASLTRARSPWLLVKLGEMHYRQGDYPNALEFYTKAVNSYMYNGNRQGKAAALLELGKVHRFRGEYNQAIPFYSEALEICTDLDDKPGRADALCVLAEVHRIQNKHGQAITFYSEALEICTDLDDKPGKASALMGLAEVHRLQNKYHRAIPCYSEALEIRTDTGDRLGKIEALWGLAEVHRLRNQFSQAIPLFSEALQISTDIGSRYWKAFSLLRLAEVRRDQRDHSNAIHLYNQAGQLFKQIGRTQHATYTSNQAAKLRQLSNREEAK